FFSSRRRHTSFSRDWSSDVCSSDLVALLKAVPKMKDQPLVFPSITGKQMSDMTISKVMRDMQERAEKAAALAGHDPAKAGWRDQIGRASCRGRVAWLWGGGCRRRKV